MILKTNSLSSVLLLFLFVLVFTPSNLEILAVELTMDCAVDRDCLARGKQFWN